MANTDDSVSVAREISAAPAIVFEGWTDPSVLGSWLIPEGCEITAADVDARPGGRYRFTFLVPGGGSQGLSGEYREFAPERRIVKTWILGNDDAAAAQPKLFTANFARTDSGGTTLDVTHQGEKNPETRVHLKEILEQAIAKLAHWAESRT